MRFNILGFLLWSGLLLAQAPADQAGRMTVGQVDVDPGSSVSPQGLRSIVEEIENDTYSLNQPEEIVERARYALQRYGYFKADVSLSSARPISPDQATIAVTLAIRKGQQYRLSEINFAGNQVVLESKLRSQFAIANGDVFDTEKVRQGLESIRRLYGSRGYINFAPVPYTDADDKTFSVTLRIDCDEAKQFYFGRLEVVGEELHPGDRDRFLSAWKPFEGRVYNADQVEQYWRDMGKFLPPDWRLEQHLKITQDPQTAIATLDVLLPSTN